jgi:hypothetical protein
MDDSNRVEIAPAGTRALLVEAAATFRGYEAHHRDRAAEAATAPESVLDIEETPSEKAARSRRRDGSIEKADRNARIAGRIEALLAGWED